MTPGAHQENASTTKERLGVLEFSPLPLCFFLVRRFFFASGEIERGREGEKKEGKIGHKWTVLLPHGSWNSLRGQFVSRIVTDRL